MQHGPRLANLQSLLRKRKVPVLLVTTPANILYLTGVDVSEGLLLVQQRRATLFVDSRYIERARGMRSAALKVFDRAEFGRIFPAMKRCGYEEQHVTAGGLRKWKALFKNTKFIHTSGLVEGLRRNKDSSEIIRVKRALAITDDVLLHLPEQLKPGITEKQLAGRILLMMLERGADGMAFDPIVAFGSNSSVPHHHTGDRALRKRDIVQIDIGARYKGYCSDRSEVYFVGEPTAEQRRVYDAVLAAKIVGRGLVRAGASCADIDRAAKAVLRKHGLARYFTHSLGHGLGLDIHEGVSLSSRSADSLLAHEVVTIEPGVYIAGKFGIRLEDTVFVK